MLLLELPVSRQKTSQDKPGKSAAQAVRYSEQAKQTRPVHKGIYEM
jgi:hypothetical protein